MALNHFDFTAFINLYEKCTEIMQSFLVIDTPVASDNHLGFRKNLLERIQKLILIIDGKIRDENLQYGIHRKTAKISALSLGKIDKYKYLKREEILPSDQSITIS